MLFCPGSQTALGQDLFGERVHGELSQEGPRNSSHSPVPYLWDSTYWVPTARIPSLKHLILVSPLTAYLRYENCKMRRMNFMKSPPANRLDSSEQQQKMRQTQFLLTGVAENTPKPASHSERSPGGRAWETPGTEASSHQSYYYSFYRSHTGKAC